MNRESHRVLVSAALLGGALLTSACLGRPPASVPPGPEEALGRTREERACSRGLQGEGSVDFFEGDQRVRGNVLFMAMAPASLRFDAYSPFGATLSTLTSDGERFALFDIRQKAMLRGEASSCNLARFTRVALPPHVLIQLLRGEAPVLRHQPGAATLDWQGALFGDGVWRVEITGDAQTTETILLAPSPEDWALPWQQQRLRVTEVEVRQAGVPLWRATLDDYRRVDTAAARTDPDGLTPPIPPSGPQCRAEIPMALRLEVPDGDRDLVLHQKKVQHNPPLLPGSFEQGTLPGIAEHFTSCAPISAQ